MSIPSRTVGRSRARFRRPISRAPRRSPTPRRGMPQQRWGGTSHRKAVRLQERHGGLSHVDLVGVREAAVEVGDPRPAGGFAAGAGRVAEPLPEGGVFVGGKGPPPVDLEEPIEEPSDGAVLHQGVDDPGKTGGQLAEEVAPDEEPVPEGPPPLVQDTSPSPAGSARRWGPRRGRRCRRGGRRCRARSSRPRRPRRPNGTAALPGRPASVPGSGASRGIRGRRPCRSRSGRRRPGGSGGESGFRRRVVMMRAPSFAAR